MKEKNEFQTCFKQNFTTVSRRQKKNEERLLKESQKQKFSDEAYDN